MYLKIKTKRLYIRPIELNDKYFVYQLLNTPGWLKFIGDRNVRNISDAENYINNILINNKLFYHVFEDLQNKQPIGIVTFIYRSNLSHPDIGYAMLPNYEKNGYAFEAVKNYMTEILKMKITHKILAITDQENINSIRLLEKLGLEFEKSYLENAIMLNLYAITS